MEPAAEIFVTAAKGSTACAVWGWNGRDGVGHVTKVDDDAALAWDGATDDGNGADIRPWRTDAALATRATVLPN